MANNKRKFCTSGKAVAGKSRTALLLSRAAEVKKTALHLSMKSRLRVTTQAVRTAVEREQQFMNELRAKYSDNTNIRLGVKRCYVLKSRPQLKNKKQEMIFTTGEKSHQDKLSTRGNMSKQSNNSDMKYRFASKWKQLQTSTRFQNRKTPLKSAQFKLLTFNGTRGKSSANGSFQRLSETKNNKNSNKLPDVVKAETVNLVENQVKQASTKGRQSLSSQLRQNDVNKASIRGRQSSLSSLRQNDEVKASVRGRQSLLSSQRQNGEVKDSVRGRQSLLSKQRQNGEVKASVRGRQSLLSSQRLNGEVKAKRRQSESTDEMSTKQMKLSRYQQFATSSGI